MYAADSETFLSNARENTVRARTRDQDKARGRIIFCHGGRKKKLRRFD